MKINDWDSLISAKLYIIELVKDSPLVLYVAFYEPLHEWLSLVADDWNPILQLLLNVMAVIWGVARLVPIFKKWFGKEEA
jgi:hypothetical protein